MDGCSRLGTLVRIILPMSLPALAVVAFFAFTQAWNEFLYATVFVNSVEVRTITTGLLLFIIEDVFFWGPMMGASFLGDHPASGPLPGLPALGRERVDAGRGQGVAPAIRREQSRARRTEE